MSADDRNNLITEQDKEIRISPGYYQLNDSIFVGKRSYKEGEVVSLRWAGPEACITNAERNMAKVTAEELEKVSHTFCKTHRIITLEQKMDKLEKKGCFLRDVADFLEDEVHRIAHKISIGFIFLIWSVLLLSLDKTGGVEPVPKEIMLDFLTSPATIIPLAVFCLLIFLYALRIKLADPLYKLSEKISERSLGKERRNVEKEIFSCGEAMVPVLKKKHSPVKVITEKQPEQKKVFPELPKVEIQETEIKLEEHNGLFLYRTFWKGKKPHNRTPRRTRKDKKAS